MSTNPHTCPNNRQVATAHCTSIMQRPSASILGSVPRVKYCESDGEDGNQPPALMIGENLIEPSDGVIVSPEDLINSLRDSVTENELEELYQLLDTVQEQLMEEWSNE